MKNTKTGLVQRCARCGDDEFREDGYCSHECRDMHEVEKERDEWKELAERQCFWPITVQCPRCTEIFEVAGTVKP